MRFFHYNLRFVALSIVFIGSFLLFVMAIGMLEFKEPLIIRRISNHHVNSLHRDFYIVDVHNPDHNIFVICQVDREKPQSFLLGRKNEVSYCLIELSKSPSTGFANLNLCSTNSRQKIRLKKLGEGFKIQSKNWTSDSIIKYDDLVENLPKNIISGSFRSTEGELSTFRIDLLKKRD